jgi:putative transposase
VATILGQLGQRRTPSLRDKIPLGFNSQTVHAPFSFTYNPTGLYSRSQPMPQSLSVVYLHLVFSTKERRPLLRDPVIRAEMHAWLGSASRELGCPSILVGGVEDHIHILARHGRTISQANWVKELKRTSSLWIKVRDARSKEFAWQAGYGVFSVSASNLDAVRDYVARQEEHHRVGSYQDEFRTLLQTHGETWDERYVWD